MSHPVFHIVTKNPEVKHIAHDMEPASVDKHKAAKRCYHSPHRIGIKPLGLKKPGGYDAIAFNEQKEMGPQGEFIEKNQAIDQNQCHVHQGKSSGRNVIF